MAQFGPRRNFERYHPGQTHPRPQLYLPVISKELPRRLPEYHPGQWPMRPHQVPSTIYTHPAEPRTPMSRGPSPASAGGLVNLGEAGSILPGSVSPAAGGLVYEGTGVHGPDWIPTSEAMRSAGPYSPGVTYNPLGGTLSTSVHGPDWTFTPEGRLEFPYTTGGQVSQQPQVDTTADAGVAGPTYRDAPAGVDAGWYRAFQDEHDGMTPEEWYQTTEGHSSKGQALVEALADRDWGDEFRKMTGRAPSEYDWQNHYYSKYGRPPSGKGYRQERRAERRERRHGKEWEEERQNRRKEPETRPAMYVPPRNQRR